MKLQVAGFNLARVLGILLLICGALGDFLSPNSPEDQNIENFFAPPTRIHFIDREGKFHFRPFVYRYELVNLLEVSYEERTEKEYPLDFFVEGWSYRLFGLIPTSKHLVGNSSPSGFHSLGTDELGRDILARVLAGARTSLVVVLVGILIYTAVGLTIGSLAGMTGRWIDSVLMRLSEFVLALPALYIILALRALLPLRLPYWQTLLLTVGVIAGVTWPPLARGARGLILQLRSAGYVEAARSLGSTGWQTFRSHILPALAPFALTQAALAAPVFILGEVLLSFLGFGFRDSDESWGSMLRNVKDPRVMTDFWWNLAPLAFVFATLLCLNLLSARDREKSITRVSL